MQDPNSLRTYLPPRQFLHEYYCLFRLLSPEFDSGDSDCRGFSFRRWPTSRLSLTRRPSCFYRLSSILSKSFCKWTMFKNIAVCVVHDPPDFRRSFFFRYKLLECKFINILYTSIWNASTKNLHRRMVSNLSACLYATIHLFINLKHLRFIF